MASLKLLGHIMLTGRQRIGIKISSLYLVLLSLFYALSSQGKTSSVNSGLAKEAVGGF